VLVAEGQQVEAGQPLVVLDTRDLNLEYDLAEASLASAQSSLTSAQASLSELLAGADENELAVASVGIDKAKDQLWGTQAQRDGVCGAVSSGRGQDYDCDQAEASVLQAEDAVRVAELQYEALLAGATGSEIAAARDKVTSAQAQVATAQAQVDQAHLRLEQATLSAPIAGTITAVNVAVAESVGASASAVELADVSTLEVVVSLDETDVSDVAVGTEAVITLDAFPDQALQGEVTAIASVGESESGVVLFPVTVAVEASDDVPARPGMSAEVDIVTMSKPDVLTIPLRAVVSDSAGSVVMRLNPLVDGGVETVAVTLGTTTDTAVEITSGLSEGDVVVVPDSSSQTPEGGPGGQIPMGGLFHGG
jgi:RND family efflux transporter MFP subunit